LYENVKKAKEASIWPTCECLDIKATPGVMVSLHHSHLFDQYSMLMEFSSSFIFEIIQHDHLLELFTKNDILGLQEALRCVVIF
jgi:hypothetical protein